MNMKLAGILLFLTFCTGVCRGIQCYSCLYSSGSQTGGPCKDGVTSATTQATCPSSVSECGIDTIWTSDKITYVRRGCAQPCTEGDETMGPVRQKIECCSKSLCNDGFKAMPDVWFWVVLGSGLIFALK